LQEQGKKNWEAWKKDLEEAWEAIPQAYRTERSIHRTLQCHLYNRLKEAGFTVVADFLPPRVQDRPVDLVAVNPRGEIHFAVCIDRLVSLDAVKSLDGFEAVEKVIFTTGMLEKKVRESRFFLKEGIEHVHLKP